MIRKLSFLAVALIGAGMLGTSPTYAATTYAWTFDSCANPGTYTMGNACTDSTGSSPTGGPSLAATAYSNTNGAIDTASDTLQTAHAELYSGGIGISNNKYNTTDLGETLSNAPEHAIDNQYYVDSLVLGFTGSNIPVSLNSLTFGYVGGTPVDGDFDLLAYTGSGTPTMTGTYQSLLTSGSWILVGQYSNSSATTVNVNTGLLTNGNKQNSVITSSYWLVAADTALLAGTALANNDYFKLQSVAATYTPPTGGGGARVPEPGSLALLGVGSLLLLRIRTRSSKS